MSRATVFSPRFRDMDGENGENGEKSKCLHSNDLRVAKIGPTDGENGKNWRECPRLAAWDGKNGYR
jgi:hypothetical protein